MVKKIVTSFRLGFTVKGHFPDEVLALIMRYVSGGDGTVLMQSGFVFPSNTPIQIGLTV